MATLLELTQKAAEEARKSNEARYQQALDIADKIGTLYTGDFGAGSRAQLERTKTQDVSSGMNALIQSGLGATGGAAGLSTAWEQSVGSEARLKLEDMIAQNQARALEFKAGIIQSKEDIYPDYSQLYNASAAGAAIPMKKAGSPTPDKPPAPTFSAPAATTYGGGTANNGQQKYDTEYAEMMARLRKVDEEAKQKATEKNVSSASGVTSSSFGPTYTPMDYTGLYSLGATKEYPQLFTDEDEYDAYLESIGSY